MYKFNSKRTLILLSLSLLITGCDFFIDPDKPNPCEINPNDPDCQNEDVLPTSLRIEAEPFIYLSIDESLDLNTSILPTNVTNKSILWSTSSKETVSVSNGKITALAVGEAVITATSVANPEINDAIRVSVSNSLILPTSLAINGPTTVGIGQTQALSVVFTPPETTNRNVVWSSNNPLLASVDALGIVTGHGVGTVTITAISNAVTSVSDTHEMVIESGAILPDSLTVTGSTTVKMDETIMLTVSILPTNADDKTVIWNSSNQEIATVNNGVVRGIKEGEVTITATSVANPVLSDKIDIIVTPKDKPVDELEIISSKEYLDLFASTSNVQINLSFINNALYHISEQGMSDNERQDIYFPANLTLTINAMTYNFEEVGVRMKGNMSRTYFVDPSGNIFGMSHFKISFDEPFDDDVYRYQYPQYYHDWSSNPQKRVERKERRLFDMEKVDLKWNRNDDQTRVKQTYAYHAFSNGEVVRPNINVVKVALNNNYHNKDYYGELLECIDSVFIKRHFVKSQNDGDLYKCTYSRMGPANLTKDNTVYKQGDRYYPNERGKIGIEDLKSNYHPSYDLKTNKKKSTHEDLSNFIGLLNDDHSQPEVFKEKLRAVLNVETYLQFEAASYLTNNPDDMRNNSNNYYIYFDSAEHKAHFIPYDYDHVFGAGWNQEGPIGRSPFSTKQAIDGAPWQTNPLLWRTFISEEESYVPFSDQFPMVLEFRDLYASYLIRFSAIVLNEQNWRNFVNQYTYSGYHDATGGDGNWSMSYYMSRKKQAMNNDGLYQTYLRNQ